MDIKKFGVVGAGMMGSEIALCGAMYGYDVIMRDISMEFAEKGKANQEKILTRDVEKGRKTEEEKQEILSRITPTDKIEDLAGCDIIIEAMSENYELKSNMYKQLDAVCKKETIFATNTSSLSVTKLASSVSEEREKQFIGTHFFSPASKMKMVEIVPGYLTDESTVEAAKEFITSIGKDFIVAKDVCGFVVNRMLNIFFIEAIRLVEEGVASPEDIDKAAKLALGHPIGPLELLDYTGLDLNLYIHGVFFDEYGERFRPRPLLKKMVAAGKYGKKSGEGFFKYDK